MDRQQQAKALANSWKTEPRWQGIQRTYSPEDVVRISSSVQIEYTLARLGAERLWHLMHTEPFVRALGALTGNQAVQQVLAGLIPISGLELPAMTVRGFARITWYGLANRV